jgi:hypothetical protein
MAEPVGNLPCLDCEEGARARREICAVYAAVRQGRTLPESATSGPWPDSCCRRRLVDVAALIA